MLPQVLSGQDTISWKSKLKFEADFRFRVEQDWDSRKSDGSYRPDRTRLRYRLRAGFTFHHSKYLSFGARLRTGAPNKQQDPQLTLGESYKEFGTLPIGFEKAYLSFKRYGLEVWAGKNTFPFEKQNELFWSDNVFPEGVFLGYHKKLKKTPVGKLGLNLGHFLISASGRSLDQDNYLQGAQLLVQGRNDRWALYPGFYYFNDMPNIPDGFETYRLNYRIAHLGGIVQPLKKIPLKLTVDGYYNFEDYQGYDSIPNTLSDQKSGFVIGLIYGKVKHKKDWLIQVTYARLEQYSIVDIMAQNDWARWDYSAYGSPDGRLTNYQGIESTVSYMVNERLKLTTKYYWVNQLVPYGTHLETNQRIRFDIDIKI
ncbi:putative porin [bacterium SCSIO 12741]|nr:putative porin [bacterium SCSIO 12741]